MGPEKLYYCHCVSEGCDDEYDLRIHYRDSHKGYKEKCYTCFNQFKKTKDLKIHEDEEHGKRSETVKPICVHCNIRTFKYSFGLKSHNAYVHDTYKVECTKCGNVFANEGDRGDHPKKHHGAVSDAQEDHYQEACKDGAEH